MQKAISKSRDRLQSRILVASVGLLLTPCCTMIILLAAHPAHSGYPCRLALEVSLTFGIVVWALRAATPAAAICGAMICLVLTVLTAATVRRPLLHSELPPLTLLFLLTLLSTRLGKHRRPELTSKREASRGRAASQVIANLGAAPLLLLAGYLGAFDWVPRPTSGWSAGITIAPALMLAALVEATADTVSSELGQAFGGTPYLLTTLRKVAPGTDGALSLLGTAAGILAGALVALTGAWSMQLTRRQTLAALAGGTAGLFFDSLLGATAERRGWLNNDLVNFSSTVFAAAVALAMLAL